MKAAQVHSLLAIHLSVTKAMWEEGTLGLTTDNRRLSLLCCYGSLSSYGHTHPSGPGSRCCQVC